MNAESIHYDALTLMDGDRIRGLLKDAGFSRTCAKRSERAELSLLCF